MKKLSAVQIFTLIVALPAIFLQETVESFKRIWRDEKGLIAGDAIDPEE